MKKAEPNIHRIRIVSDSQGLRGLDLKTNPSGICDGGTSFVGDSNLLLTQQNHNFGQSVRSQFRAQIINMNLIKKDHRDKLVLNP